MGCLTHSRYIGSCDPNYRPFVYNVWIISRLLTLSMDGKLFSQDFLHFGITETPVWQDIDEHEFNSFSQTLTAIYQNITANTVMNEANTESEVIDKVLSTLGWHELSLKQVTATKKRRDDVPDYLLFANADKKGKAQAESKEDKRYLHGISIVEAKKWLRPLDRGDETNQLDPSTPSNQILRYLSSVEIASNRAISFGILTNGALWRLYWQGARSRSEEFLEIDLAAALQVKGIDQNLFGLNPEHILKVFYCIFNRNAFTPQNWDNAQRTFHAFALNEARLYEERVSENLGKKVFEVIFPQIADALAANDEKANLTNPQYLDELREATLVLLYRLLFIFYAEDRHLLPVKDTRYDDYALRTIREDIAKRRDINDALSNSASKYWQHLSDLFRIISKGDTSIGMPAYNGGLFEETRAPILSRARLPDAVFAPLLDDLSRSFVGKQADLFRSYINYRDLSVQHLGGIYERLLEYSLVVENKRIVARPASFARKTSGSYYTHDGLVQLVIKEAVGPQIAERLSILEAQLDAWKNKKEIKPEEWKVLEHIDPASAILELKICDPAMGSGHFLVTLVDFLADHILEIMAQTELLVANQTWAQDITNPYVSPLVGRVKEIRNRILSAAHKERWAVTDSQLDDKHIVRRMILKRVVYGVDKNPMAVELAKVALWLHTFTVGAPLSFLDHHLRCGDSLFGGKVSQIKDALNQQGSLIYQNDLQRLDSARMLMDAIGNLTDIDIAEAHHSKAMMDEAEAGLSPLKRLLDFLQSKAWAPKDQLKAYNKAWADLLACQYGDTLLESMKFYSERKGKLPGEEQQTLDTIKDALARADAEHFLHWELAFPTVWAENAGGFDAIIGNPPWDRIKLQEVEWFAERKPEIAKATKAADRKKLINQLEQNQDQLWQDYQKASVTAEIASKVARTCGDYPLLSGGDINLYSLFVERASHMVKVTGIVGLITPSGIAADLGASAFFRTLSETGRLSSLFDFENKKVFFPDVHASFKFCALAFGGKARTFNQSRCAFYLHKIAELNDLERILHLSANDFAAVNPNTGAAPIFKSARDAKITTAIYKRHPVLVDKRNAQALKQVWPVKYVTMFHMTNDSNLFLTAKQLELEGYYPIDANRWKKGEAEAVPLYEGKMVQMYDHRAASVVVNVENLKRPAQQEANSDLLHEDPNFVPAPQFWVNASDVNTQYTGEWSVAYKSITAPTNIRTMISAILPKCGVGNSMAMLLPNKSEETEYKHYAPLLLANIACFVFDFVLRQKVQGQNLNWFMVEQLPLIKPEQFEQTLGKTIIADYVRSEVLHLTYTAHDLAPFARDMGYVDAAGNVKPPIVWDATDRLHRQCRLDALFFHLYDINRDDAAYILDQFPIIERQDRANHNRYLTKELILAYMNAVKSGDFLTIVKI